MEPQEKIFSNSLALFYKYGIKHVTMDDIARDLGMSKKTIYQFYKEKDDLVNQLVDLQLKDQQVDFEKIRKQAKDPIHEIILISEHLRQMLQNINPVFFLDLQKFYPTAFKVFQKFKEDCAYKNILENVKEGIKTGIYRPELDPEFTSRLRMAQIDMLMFGGYFNYEKVTLAKTQELVLEYFVYGICTLEGHKIFDQYRKITEE